jgi:glycosyltransferase involved in cell wall biosynthesis
MRILQIHPLLKSEVLSPAAGGMAGAALHLTRLLAAAGHEVQVMPIPEGLGSRELWEVAPGRVVDVAAVMHIPGWREVPWLPGSLARLRPRSAGVKNLLYDSFALTALRRELQLFRPEIIHNHLARPPFPRLARALGLRGNLVLTHHHGEAGEGLDAYDRIVFPSQSARETISAQAGVPAGRTRCIYSPVGAEFDGPPVEAGRPRAGVLYVGAVRRRKGIDLLLDAYRLDRGLWKDPLTVCGDGEDAGLVRRAADEGLPVQWAGHLSRTEVAARLLDSRLAVMPSRLESFGIALLEAACCGVPVVGWAPTVRELETRVGVPVGAPFDGRSQSAAELAAAMRSLLQREEAPEDRPRLAAAARAAFSAKRYLDEYLALYAELLHPVPPTPGP